MSERFSLDDRVERLIAAGRLLLVLFVALAVALDPGLAAARAHPLLPLLWLYFGFAVLLACVEWSLPVPLRRLRVPTHAFDLAVFSLLLVADDRPASPLLVCFAFSLFAAAVRWRRQGVLWTTGAVVLAQGGTSLHAVLLGGDPALELPRLVLRAASLGVVSALLGSLTTHEDQARGALARLAAWPRPMPDDDATSARQGLAHAAEVFQAPRAMMAWKVPGEVDRRFASWIDGQFSLRPEPAASLDPLVAGPPSGATFLAVGGPPPVVLYTGPDQLGRWRGDPLSSELRRRLGPGSVLGLALHAEHVEGYLFVLDPAGASAGDLVLGEILARQVASQLEDVHVTRRRRDGAVLTERVRLARELHDGVLQSLAGTALELEALRLLVQDAPQAAQDRLRELRNALAVEQRVLRGFIRRLRPSNPGGREGLGARLEALRSQVEQQWGLRVELDAARLSQPIPDELAYELVRIVQEALVNAARHARASVVRVQLVADEREIRILVADDGQGFPFRGRYDLSALDDLHLGPVTLKERVAAQGGSLAIDSTETGSSILVTVPLAAVTV
jgi:signal transduction histidine kinase